MKTLGKILLLSAVVFAGSSCREDFDMPPIDAPVFNGNASITIKAFIAKYDSIMSADKVDLVLIQDEDIIGGYVAANDISGNIYKQIQIQDETGGLCVAIDRNNIYNDYRVGQQIFIACKDLYIGKYGGYPQLGYKYSRNNDEVYSIGQMTWQRAQDHFFPNGYPDVSKVKSDTLTIGQLSVSQHVGHLITVTDVCFENAGNKFAEPGAGGAVQTVSKNLFSVSNPSLKLVCRNSSVSNFAGKPMPAGVGSVTGVLSIYNNTLQITFRDSLDCSASRFNKEGTGDKVLPWSIDYALKHQDGTTKGWIQGYIVGAVKPGINADNPIKGNADINFAPPFLNNTVVLAASADVKDWTKCVVVNLPEGSAIQTVVNLLGTPGNAGKLLKVTGTLQKYLGAAGLITNGMSSDFELEGVASGGAIIYNETFGTTAVQTGTAWPTVAAYTGYEATGPGAAKVTYTAEGGAVTIRTNSPSTYPGASGVCNAMLASTGASLLVNDIATCGATILNLSFGSNEADGILSVAYKINGTSQWVPISYTKPTATWGLVSDLMIVLPTGTNTIKLKFTAAVTSYGTRVDDIAIRSTNTLGDPVIDPDDDNPQPDGGTKEKPFTVAEGIAKQGTNDVWVKGYIVGCVKADISSVASANDVFIGVTSGFNSATNVLLADNVNETDYKKCIVVNLPSGKPLRTEVNLQNNPGNIGKTLNVKGNLKAYFGLPGSRENVDGVDFVLEEGGTIEPPPPPPDAIFLETCGSEGQNSGQVAPADYTGWDNKAPVTYSGNVVVRKTNSLDTHLWFAAWSTQYPDHKYLTISGINTAGCSDMKLSFDVTHNGTGAVKANLMSVKVKDMNTGTETTLTVPATDLSPNSFSTVSNITGIPATSNLQITFGTSETNTMGFRLDNMRIDGVKP